MALLALNLYLPLIAKWILLLNKIKSNVYENNSPLMPLNTIFDLFSNWVCQKKKRQRNMMLFKSILCKSNINCWCIHGWVPDLSDKSDETHVKQEYWLSFSYLCLSKLWDDMTKRLGCVKEYFQYAQSHPFVINHLYSLESPYRTRLPLSGWLRF